MGDHLRAGKLSRYITSHPGQLSLAIPLRVCAMNTSLGWVGNRIGLTSHWPYVTDISGLSTYGLDGPRKEMSTPLTLLRNIAFFTFTMNANKTSKVRFVNGVG